MTAIDITPLLPHVSDWNITDAKGDTLIHIILQKSYNLEASLTQLLKVGANPNIKNKAGLVPLHTVRELNTRSKGAMELLLKSGLISRQGIMKAELHCCELLQAQTTILLPPLQLLWNLDLTYMLSITT